MRIQRIFVLLLLGFPIAARAQTTIAGADLALKSGGSGSGEWVLSANGFVGTYVQLGKPGRVTISIDAHARGLEGPPPELDVVLGDSMAKFELTGEAKSYERTFDLPAGTWFVRIEYVNHKPSSDTCIAIDKLSVSGAAVRDEHTDANALAAADSYIANYRRGTATVKLDNIAPGTQIRAKLKRHTFMFGAAVGGFGPKQYFDPNAAPGSDARRYQDVLRTQFQAIVPGNAGKWAYNEDKRDVITMDYIDVLRDEAKKRGIPMRMHTMLWNTGQQPRWVVDLVDAAANGDERAKSDLRRAISKRIGYYIRDRAISYAEMDVLNEPLHQSKYWQIFGAAGIADIYREAAQALADAGASTRLFVNEYNILQYSSRPPFKKGAEPDPYANWYREHVEAIRAAGGPIGGIGVQYYAFTEPDIPSPHSAARIFGVFQNLSVIGLPIILSEFGVKTRSDPNRVPGILEDTMRISFGTPNSTGFIMWGFWKKDLWDQANGAAFYDDNWNPTPTCKRWNELMSRWTTDETLTVSSAGTIGFTGYFGDYELTVGEKSVAFTLVKGQAQYSVAIP